MERIVSSDHEKIIHEVAAVKQSLRADAGFAGYEIGGSDFWDELLQAVNKGVFYQGAVYLLHSLPEILAGKPPKAAEPQVFAKVAEVEIRCVAGQRRLNVMAVASPTIPPPMIAQS